MSRRETRKMLCDPGGAARSAGAGGHVTRKADRKTRKARRSTRIKTNGSDRGRPIVLAGLLQHSLWAGASLEQPSSSTAGKWVAPPRRQYAIYETLSFRRVLPILYSAPIGSFWNIQITAIYTNFSTFRFMFRKAPSRTDGDKVFFIREETPSQKLSI